MSRRRLGIVATVVLMMVAVGCSDDDEPTEPGDTPSSSSDSTSDPTTEPTTEPTTGPTTGPSEPVEGTRFELGALSFVLPEPYEGEQQGDLAVLGLIGPDDPVGLIQVLATPSGGDLSLEQVKERHFEASFYETRPKTLDPVTVDGVEMLHLAGQTDDITWTEVFGSDETGHTIDITMDFRLSTPAAERQQVVDAVLGSITLT